MSFKKFLAILALLVFKGNIYGQDRIIEQRHLLEKGASYVLSPELAHADEAILKLGYVPTTFPRDVIEVNQFAEHAILGQILEPLVDADRFGNMIPGIAESWTVSKDGKTFIFKITSKRFFSNGKPITGKDVIYTLQRHLTGKSQSSNFLNAIKSIKNSNPNEITITLNEQNVSILKALTRDQLGIVPEGWTFDTNSDEPFIGSGPYRLKRKNSKWLLTLNEKFPARDKISVHTWELIYFGPTGSGVLGTPLPDYVPMITQHGLDDLEKEFKAKKVSIESKEQLSFVQTSLWWYPHGEHYRSPEVKASAMNFLRTLVEIRCQQTERQRATGIVPVGVAGYLPKQVKFEAITLKPFLKIQKIHIAGMGILFDFLFDGNTAKEIAAKYNIEFEYFKFTPTTLNELKIKKPDIVMGSWAGGFNDPEGFLPLLNQLLAIDFVKYLEDLAPLYQKARVEQNWTKRSDYFREFNERLVREQRMIPGWKIPMYSLIRPSLKEEEIGFRYTPRLINVKKIN